MRLESKAKEMFRYYKGSHFLMEREGEYTIYKGFNISREIEIEWLKEMQQEALDRFNHEVNIKEKALLFSEYGFIIGLSKDIQGYHFMRDYIRDNVENSDSESLLRNTNAVLNLLNIVNQNERKEIIKEALEWLRYITNNPISISDDYKVNGVLGEFISEETILSHTKANIEHLEKELEKLTRKRFWNFWK